ncbi:GntR family transcriptional regulator [Actinotalea sp. K2]|uniref:GntR family transcriptional regulator n=1 Tax=Actinotalea sp. K2 TaxID=2939438 RepID=UPI002017AF9C|nr:GntR family transcriptional regulator [Actinotalea sp. K2]MCL3859671.1 GntR family transcriptional regulator [Actinotalea sp. K2]
MLFRIDPTAAEPLFEQLAVQVRSAVARGDLTAGTRLPAARDLAASLAVNLHTVLRAYQELRDEGLIELHRGRGAVISTRAEQDYLPLREALDLVVRESRHLGLAPGTTTALLKEALR